MGTLGFPGRVPAPDPDLPTSMLQLLRKRSFGAMTAAQFLGAFNDNAFKQVVVLLAAAAALPGAEGWVAENGLTARLAGSISPQAIPPFLFALPFVLFGPITGSLADRVSKSRIIQAANFLEIVVMVLATTAFALQSYGVLLGAVFLMGTQSALFGPSKYGSIQEMVGGRELSRANALIQASTMIAVLMGVFMGGILLDEFREQLWIAGIAYIGFAIVGWTISLRIEHLPARDPGRKLNWNPVSELISHWRATEGNRHLILAVLASGFFYLVAAAFLIVVPTYGKWLGLGDMETSMLSAMSGVGIVIGAVIAGRVSGDRIEGGLIPLGLLGMAVCLTATGLDPESARWIGTCMLGMGVFAGLFTIPIRCLIQELPRVERKGAVQGLAEVVDFIGVLLATPLFIFWDKVLELSPPAMFLAGALMLTVLAIVSVAVAGEFLVRVVLLGLTHTLYRLRIVGRVNLPESGGALLVANHVSFIDAILLAAAARRPVRFLMFRAYFDVPVVGWFARRMGAIPVSGGDSASAKREALAAAAESAASGEIVAIFAEGSITRTGMMLPFRRGLERIARDSGVPIIPVAIDRLWGSLFSYERGRFFWKVPRQLPYRVDVIFGESMPSDTPADRVRSRVVELIARERSRRNGPRGSLGWRFLVTAKRNAGREAIVDSMGARLTYRGLAIRTLAMRSVLRETLPEGEPVAVLLPPGAAGFVINLAAALEGRTTVNLNATLDDEELARLAGRTGATRVITSRRLLEKLGRGGPFDAEHTLDVEDLAGRVTTGHRIGALARWCLPTAWLARIGMIPSPRKAVATVLFSSGSSGDPKGVVLSHANVLGNVQSLREVLPIGPGDSILAALPLFHSFGYTATLWATMLGGARAVCHPDPRDAKGIDRIGRNEGITHTLATPTFYQAWMRRISPEAFSKLRVAISGAERLRPALAEAFEERYGVRLHEGYGCTECAPGVSFNLPGAEDLKPHQRGAREGTVGRPLPGVAVRIADLETGEMLPPAEDGMVQVMGPNVMVGYLGDEERTAEVLSDGWYTTGDVGHLDKDGFLVLTGRLSRFSKIGGEMVPHGRVEEALEEALRGLAPEAESELVVTGVADERKGERLVVLHTPMPVEVDALVDRLRESELPALFLPRPGSFVEVPDLPRLGTGKIDLRGVAARAKELAG